MEILSSGILSVLFILICCLCSFLIALIALFVYVLGSTRVRQALLTLGLVKTVFDVLKEVFGIVRSNKKKKSSSSANKNTSFLDVEVREKKSKD